MILAAGLGTRLRPLSETCAKPAMPVRGIPVIAHTLTLLAQHDVTEVVINVHHLPETVRKAVERHRPPSLEVRYSEETELLGTGGGMRRVADFLAESDPSLVLAGDMLLDLDLTDAVARHRESRARYSLLVSEDDPRGATFGTLGFDDEGCLRRIGRRFDLGGETRSGLFLGVRIVAARCLTDWPDASSFEDLGDWLAPQLEAGCRDIVAASISTHSLLWEPVGTAEEYLAVNFDPPPLSYREEVSGAAEAEVMQDQLIIGTGATVDARATLERVVVWPNETVPAGVRARNGVFAAGQFVACTPDPDTSGHENRTE